MIKKIIQLGKFRIYRVEERANVTFVQSQSTTFVI